MKSCQAPNKILKTQAKTIKIFAFLICVFGFWFLNFDFAFAGWTSGKFGSAINFDGVNDYVNSNSSLAAASAFSHSLWFKSSDGSFAADEYLFSQGTNDPSVYLESTDNKVKVMADGADKLSSAKTVNNTEWRHLEITADGAAIKLYLDGVLESSASYTGSSAAGIFYVASSAVPGSYFGGIIDDVRVYNYARTQDEILADYNSGKAAHLGKDSQRDDGLVGYWNMEEGTGQTISDRSGNGNSGTLGANSSVGKDDPVFTSGYSSSGPGGTGLKFDGKDDYVEVANNASLQFTDNLTLCSWHYDPGAANGAIMGKVGGTWTYMLVVDHGAQQFYLRLNMTVFNYQTSLPNGLDIYHNKWVNLCATYDKSNVRLYINGELKRTTVFSDSITTSSDNFAIGARGNNNTLFNSLIDEVRVYNRALSADEIRQLYNQKKPILEMKFDEGSGQIAYDGSFNNNDGTLGSTSGSDANDPTWTVGKYGSALSFDGTDDYVNAGNSGLAFNFDTEITISAWIKPSGTQVGRIFNKWDGGAEEKSLFKSNDGTVRFYLNNCFGGSALSSVTTLSLNKWYHIVGVYNGSRAFIYINGVQDNSKAASGNVGDGTGNLYLGANPNRGAESYYFKGIIDEPRIYSYARTQDEILADYNSGKAAHLGKDSQRDDGLVGYWNMEEGTGQTISDRSGNGNNGTLGASTSVGKDDPVFTAGYSSAGPSGTALQFDGKDDYVSIGPPFVNIADGYTLSAWVNSSSVTTQAIIMVDNSVVADRVFQFYILATGNIGFLRFNAANGVIETITTSGVNTRDGNWHYITATFSSLSGSVIYMDGISRKTGSLTTQNRNIGVGTEPIRIGMHGGSSPEYFNGLIDEVRVYNRALSADEIRQLYNQKKPILEMKFDEGSGQIAYDGSFNNNDGTLGSTSVSDANDPTWTVGKYGSALSFDGTDDYVNAGDINVIDIANQLTVSAWVYHSSITNDDYIAQKRAPAGGGGFLFLRDDNGADTGRTDIYTILISDTGGSSARIESATNSSPLNVWTHVAFTFVESNASGLRLYINGAEDANSPDSTLAVAGLSNAVNFLIGQFNSGDYFNGLIDEPRIYNYARTQDEILADYNNGLAAHLR